MNKKTFIIRTIGQARDLAHKISQINPLNKDQPLYQITVEEYKTTRSIAQNRMMWMWLKLTAEHINLHAPAKFDELGQPILFTDDDMHELFKATYLPTKVIEFGGTVIRKHKSTAKLKTGEFTDYLEKIDQYCAEHLNLVLPHPEDLYWAAMGLTQKGITNDTTNN